MISGGECCMASCLDLPLSLGPRSHVLMRDEEKTTVSTW